PYTAYLIVEDERQRAVPLTLRSMQEFDKDVAAQRIAGFAWSDFSKSKDGARAVGNARSQNELKFANQPAAAVARNGSEMLAGVTTAAPAERAESARLARYTQQTRFVNGRAFFQNGNQWVDANAQNLTSQKRVRFNSEEYFD